MGALYLCNAKALDYTDSQMEMYLGRIGTFVTTFFATTTLCQSPHLTQAKVSGYEDYSIDWANACNQFKINQRNNQCALVELIEGASRPLSDEEAVSLREQFFPRGRV